jgi:hypothetical protein
MQWQLVRGGRNRDQGKWFISFGATETKITICHSSQASPAEEDCNIKKLAVPSGF